MKIVSSTKNYLIVESPTQGGIFRRSDSSVVDYPHGEKWDEIVSQALKMGDHARDQFLAGEFRMKTKEGHRRPFGK